MSYITRRRRATSFNWGRFATDAADMLNKVRFDIELKICLECNLSLDRELPPCDSNGVDPRFGLNLNDLGWEFLKHRAHLIKLGWQERESEITFYDVAVWIDTETDIIQDARDWINEL